MSLLVNLMILKLLLELLALLPQLGAQVKAAMVEVHSTDSTGTKIANVATIAAALAGTATDVINEAASAVETK